MTRSILSPILVLLGIGTAIALMAETNLFIPLVKFIHSEAVTPLEAAGCLVFTIFGFAACYYLLNILCTYFVPRMDEEKKNKHTHTARVQKIIEEN